MATINKYPAQVRGMNGYDNDLTLQDILNRLNPEFLNRRRKLLSELGEFVLGEMDEQAEESDRFFSAKIDHRSDNPTNPDGERRGHIKLNKRYKETQQALYKFGTLSETLKDNDPESQMLPFITQYLAGKSDISTGCPYAMTHPVALVIKRFAPRDIKNRFLPELMRTDGFTPIGGTWATEKHSGSNVGGTTTKAFVDGYGNAVLQGLKWFTSAIGFDRFLTVATARPDRESDMTGKGLGLYLVPSHIDEDWQVPNSYNVRHLKEKIGTRALPTGETQLTDTQAFEIVPPPNGLKAMMYALGCSRVHNAMSAAGVMHRAYLEALCWVENREPSEDEPLIQKQMIQKRVLEIHTQWQAGAILAFEAAQSFDDVHNNKPEGNENWMRLITALAKYKTAEQAVWCAEKALELVGGNGVTEEYPVARQFRDSMVLRVWEGPEQIQALELLRLLSGKAKTTDMFLDRLNKINAELPNNMYAAKSNLAKLHSELMRDFIYLERAPETAELVADELLAKMSDILSYALLCEQAGWDIQELDDTTRKLTAEQFYNHTFGSRAAIKFRKTPLHEHFNDIVRDQRIPKNPNARPQPLNPK